MIFHNLVSICILVTLFNYIFKRKGQAPDRGLALFLAVKPKQLIPPKIRRPPVGDVGPELVILPRQDGVQRDPRDGGDGQGRQGDLRAAHLEGEPAGEAQAAHQNHRRDDQVPGVGEVHPVLHHVPHADGGDHAV